MKYQENIRYTDKKLIEIIFSNCIIVYDNNLNLYNFNTIPIKYHIYKNIANIVNYEIVNIPDEIATVIYFHRRRGNIPHITYSNENKLESMIKTFKHKCYEDYYIIDINLAYELVKIYNENKNTKESSFKILQILDEGFKKYKS